MREPSQYSARRDSEDSDLGINSDLKELKNKSLKDLWALQYKIAKKYTDVTDKYQAERTNIRWAKRYYWALNFVSVFREIWRTLILGKESQYTKLSNKKSALEKAHTKQSSEYDESLTLINTFIRSIESNLREISNKMKNWNESQAIIERLDVVYHGLEAGDGHKAVVTAQLLEQVEKRDSLNRKIESLHQEIKALVNQVMRGLFDILPKEVTIESVELLPTEVQEINEIADDPNLSVLQEICKDRQEPLMKAMVHFLTYRTDAALSALKLEMSNLESREMLQLIEKAGALDSRITEGWVKEDELPSIREIQQNEMSRMADTLKALNEKHDQLTDNKVELVCYIEKELPDRLENINKRQKTLLNLPITAYVERRKTDAMNEADKETFNNIRQELAGTNRMLEAQKANLKDLDKEIKRVEEQQQQQCVIEPVLFTQEILDKLVMACQKEKSPVSKALAAFLGYPTVNLLAKLKWAMAQEDQKDQKSPLLEEANRYFPYILPKEVQKHSHSSGFFQAQKLKEQPEAISPFSKKN